MCLFVCVNSIFLFDIEEFSRIFTIVITVVMVVGQTPSYETFFMLNSAELEIYPAN